MAGAQALLSIKGPHPANAAARALRDARRAAAFRSASRARSSRFGSLTCGRSRNVRPPWMRSWPCHLPDCREIGARPARLAACFPSRLPSSGISISMANAVASAIPGMLIRMASFCDSSASRPTVSAIAASISWIWPSICLSRAVACRLRRLDVYRPWILRHPIAIKRPSASCPSCRVGTGPGSDGRAARSASFRCRSA